MTFEWRTGRENKRIEEISEREIESKRSLGTAYGFNLGHCVYLATKYCREFAEKARWYRIIETDERLEELRRVQWQSIGVEFYAEK